MRVLATCTHRDDRWTIQCLAADARTTIAPHIQVARQDTLMRLLRYIGASEEELADAERDTRRWGIASVWIDLIPGRKNLLQIREPWRTQAGIAEAGSISPGRKAE